MRIINKLIIHCSDTPDFEPGDTDFDRFGKKDIDKWHRANGWRGCGYHYVIRRTGKIQKGRPEEEQGAHCKGVNEDSIGVCYIGRKRPTSMQLAALYSLCYELMDRYNLDEKAIYGHNVFNPLKTCPGFSITKLLKTFKEYQTIPW